jgi:hypothetical protein
MSMMGFAARPETALLPTSTADTLITSHLNRQTLAANAANKRPYVS